MDKRNPTIKLKGGRTLGYAEYGAPEGKPVFYFHGFPGSRIDWLFSDTNNTAAQLNARIIAVDRPGMGLSSFQRGREILDWSDDVIEIANVLQLDRFAVLCRFSGYMTTLSQVNVPPIFSRLITTPGALKK